MDNSIEQGYQFLLSKDFKSAIKVFTALILLEPDNPHLCKCRAQAHHLLDDRKAAIDDMEKAIALTIDSAKQGT